MRSGIDGRMDGWKWDKRGGWIDRETVEWREKWKDESRDWCTVE